MKIEIVTLIFIFILFITSIKLAIDYTTLADKFSSMNKQIKNINDMITMIKKSIENMSKPNNNDYIYVEISEIISNPSSYIGKRIAVIGTLHFISTIPEIKLPYNAIISSDKEQIGVLISSKIYDNTKVIIKGILVKGYQVKLGKNGWIKEKKIYYIIAIEIKKI